MTSLKMGDEAPDFCLPNQDGEKVCLHDHKGRWVVLYFYPKDNTSGCTLEAMDFTASRKDFEEKGATVIGVSPDSVKSHVRFREKHDLTINLLSDEEKDALNKYGAWQMKKMYGREYMGVVRSTYLITPEGKIAYIWPKVKVKGHVEDVMKKLEEAKS
jgi:peroxiredoxin Q/BCP